MEVVLLCGVAGLGLLWVNLNPNTAPPDGTKKDPDQMSRSDMFDLTEGGMHYSTYKTQALASTSLNDAYAPYQSPATEPTYSIAKVFQAIADNGAVVKAYAPNWYLKHWMEIPRTTAQQATANVWIPGPKGFKGGASLANYPRATMETASDQQFSSRKNMRMGYPTESETKSVYPMNKIPMDHNPYAGGAPFQRLEGSRYARNTKKNGTNLSSLPNTANISAY